MHSLILFRSCDILATLCHLSERLEEGVKKQVRKMKDGSESNRNTGVQLTVRLIISLFLFLFHVFVKLKENKF